jgi:predicted phosphodiesterase
MKKITFIGDVHGKLEQYKKIIDNCDESICVGDFGFKKEWDWAVKNLTNLKHWINQGNHDDPSYRKKIPSLGRFSHYENKIFTVAGADSIDKHLRTEGVDWFPNEELNYQEQLEAFDLYCNIKPNVVVSHDCPQEIMKQLFGYPEKSQTRTMLQAMLNEHQPDVWIFGHFHTTIRIKIHNTEFICLNELEKFTIDF